MIRERPILVLLGSMTKMPVAGVVWQTMHYILGFERLGYDVYYVEAHARTPSMLMTGPGDDSGVLAAAFIAGVMGRFDRSDRWAYQALHDDGACFGMTDAGRRQVFDRAELVVNLHGGTRPRPEHHATGRLIYLGTDPVQLELELARDDREAIEFLEPHSAFFTFAENYGRPECRLPTNRHFDLQPTRQPVVTELWRANDEPRPPFTTIANWRQHWREVEWEGDTFHWSKHLEFLKLVDLPSRTEQPLELALANCGPEETRLLRENGWTVRDSLAFSANLDAYRDYILRSRGEFTVAKDQNLRFRTGWFSDRAATYLASGRPVVTQDTGFGSALPVGEGLFAWRTPDDALDAIESINADYDRHSAAAREIASELFSAERVPRLAPRTGRRAVRVLMVAHRFPPDAVAGVERYTESLAGRLSSLGDRVTVVSRRPAPGPVRLVRESDRSDVSVVRLEGGGVDRDDWLHLGGSLDARFAELLEEVAPDVVHANHLVDLSPRFLMLARRAGSRRRSGRCTTSGFPVLASRCSGPTAPCAPDRRAARRAPPTAPPRTPPGTRAPTPAIGSACGRSTSDACSTCRIDSCAPRRTWRGGSRAGDWRPGAFDPSPTA